MDGATNYREVWNAKQVLREIYGDIYRRMMTSLVPGLTLEVGGGSGNFKSFAPATVTTDIVTAPWIDVACDAQRLPFADAAFANVIMVDVLHHIEFPVRALKEFHRVLRPGGRLIMCEPAITPASWIFYKLLHPEPVDMSADPLRDGAISPDKDPFDSNQAIPTLLTGRDRRRLARIVPGLVLARLEKFSFIAYPLSGGFRPWSLIPAFAVKPLLEAEWMARRLLGPLAAFRLLAEYRKVH